MTGRTHDLAAVTSLTVFLAFQSLPPVTVATAITCLAATMIGAVTPDIDQPTASLWRKIPAGSIFGHIISPLLGHHRMISHSIVGMAIFGFGLSYLLDYTHKFLLVDNHMVWYAFMLGYLSHLLMDTITKEGVPWFFPVPIRVGLPPLKFLRVTTGSWMENILVFPGLLLLNGYLIYFHYSAFHYFIHSLVK